MDRRLVNAYDKMTMPDGCSRRIEIRLQEQMKAKKERRYTMVLNERSRRSPWAAASALVCLAIVLSVGGVALFLGMQGQLNILPSNIPQFSQPEAETTAAATETAEAWDPDSFPYGREAMAFLEQMCHVMPQWDGYATLDDVFWTEFVVRIINEWSYEVQTEGRSSQVETPAGTGLLVYQENKIFMPRETINAFVQEIMGCELPDFVPSGQFQSMISCQNEAFVVDVTEINRYHYELESCDTEKGWSQVTFGVYADPEQPPIGRVNFQLCEAENERGYIIVGRPTELRTSQMEDGGIEEVALTFARAFFAADIEMIKSLLSDRENSAMILNPFVQEAYNKYAEDEEYEILGVRIFNTALDAQEPVAFVDYAFIPQRGYPAHSLILGMVQSEEGWKVRSWDEGNPEDYDPDRGDIYDTTISLTSCYLWGNAGGMQDYMTSHLHEPPVYEGEVVYEGEAGYPQIQKVEIDFDPLDANEAGEMMADAFVEIQESPDAMNPMALYLHFVKQDGVWKVDQIGEG